MLNRRCFLGTSAAAAFCSLAATAPAHAQAARPEIKRPGDEAADQSQKVKVFILMGQSNMLGFGRVGPKETKGSLEYMIHEKGKYGYLVDEAGNWTVRKDVRYVHVMDKRGVDYKNMDDFADMKNDWLTVKGNFGPELGFGHIMGQMHQAPVLVLKACIGNRSLGWDLLPPGSERYVVDGRTYAGYKETPDSWIEGQPKKEVPWYAGRQYDADTAHSKAVLKNLEKYYPGYQGQGYEVTGFLFWQGHKDQNAAHAGRYEQNLVRLIKSLRKDFASPEAKFVVATGCGSPGREGFALQIAEAQLAVDGDGGKYPEFKGNVKSVDVRPFWRDADVSPTNQGYHYNHNAETYMEVGQSMGWAMADLLQPA